MAGPRSLLTVQALDRPLTYPVLVLGTLFGVSATSEIISSEPVHQSVHGKIRRPRVDIESFLSAKSIPLELTIAFAHADFGISSLAVNRTNEVMTCIASLF